MTISRYLFRDDVLIDSGNSIRTFDEVSKKDDRMLAMHESSTPNQYYWTSYRLVLFEGNSWGWLSMPNTETVHLRALLLLQQ